MQTLLKLHLDNCYNKNRQHFFSKTTIDSNMLIKLVIKSELLLTTSTNKR